MAKTLEVKTMYGSLVTAKMAGMESTAKITSVTSMRASAKKRGVASHLPFAFVKKWLPSRCGLAGTMRRRNLKTALFSGWSAAPPANRSFTPVRIRKAPKT